MLHPSESRTLTLAITGASGSIFAAKMLKTLDADDRVKRIFVVVSENALRVFAEELEGISGRSTLVEKILGKASSKIKHLAHEDVGAPIASGSFPCDGMIVLPCSMGTLAGIAHGTAGNLIERAADVCLKERRPLILCVRETPLNLIHVRNMVSVTEAGATVFPVTPTFYNHPESVDDVVRNYVDRVLAYMGLPQPGAYRWGSEQLTANS
jgi:4-hydroxy-3-polyprenylbenzoate decarboxylase